MSPVPQSSSFYSKPITGHLSAAHAILHHTVTKGRLVTNKSSESDRAFHFSPPSFCAGAATEVFSPVHVFKFSCFHTDLTRNSSRFNPVAMGWNMSQLMKGPLCVVWCGKLPSVTTKTRQIYSCIWTCKKAIFLESPFKSLFSVFVASVSES